jgi:uncharacterized membrane protein
MKRLTLADIVVLQFIAATLGAAMLAGAVLLWYADAFGPLPAVVALGSVGWFAAFFALGLITAPNPKGVAAKLNRRLANGIYGV